MRTGGEFNKAGVGCYTVQPLHTTIQQSFPGAKHSFPVRISNSTCRYLLMRNENLSPYVILYANIQPFYPKKPRAGNNSNVKR